MSLLHDVAIQDSVEVVDSVARTPSRIDVLIQDVIAVSDLVVLPRMAAIHSIEPGRVRANESAVISGQGFATSTTGNRVTFNGFVATVTAAAEDELTVTVPALIAFAENGYAVVEVESPPLSLLKGRGFVWVKWSTAEEEAGEVLPLQLADLDETQAEDSPRQAEAEDFGRLQTLVEHGQQGGAEGSAGGFKAGDGDGALVGIERRNPPNNLATGGESLVVDPSAAGLIAFGWQLDDALAFGGVFQIVDSGWAFLRANGTPFAALNLVEIEQVVMLDGVIDLVWFAVTGPGGDFITATDLYVNGISAFLDFSNWAPPSVASFRLSIPVSKGDRIKLRVDKSGLTDVINVVGGARVRYR